MKCLLRVGTIALLLTSCGTEVENRVKTTSTTSTTSVRYEAQPLVKEVDEGAIYLGMVKAENDHRANEARAARSRKRTTNTTQAQRSTTSRPNASPKGSASASEGNSSSVQGSDVWARLAKCESGGNTSAISSNGLYYGVFQFSLATWKSVGENGNPTEYSYQHQLEAAQRLQARSGWGQWPHCSRRLGLR